MSDSQPTRLEFFKYSGAGNDFILLDCRVAAPSGDPSVLAKALCRRGRSVGADGLILLEEADAEGYAGAAVRMRLWNADGSSAEISGNGARCVARYLVDRGEASDKLVLATDIGPVQAWVDGDVSRVRLPLPGTVEPGRRIRVEGRDITGTYVEVGVPFFVVFHDNLEELPINFLGRAIRNHPDLAPRGANVDFVRVEDEQRVSFRVYERGVEAETLSSGTGSIAAALAAAADGKVHSPVACVARGATLTVRFRASEAATEDAEIPGEMSAADRGETPGETADAGNAAAAEGNGETPGEAAAASDAGISPTRSSEGTVAFIDLEVEGDAEQIYRGEAFEEAWTS